VRPTNNTFFAFGAFVVWTGLSYFWSSDPDKTFARTSTYLQLVLLAWLIWQEARTSRACVALMKAYIAGAAIACAAAIIARNPVHNGVERFSIGDPNDFGVVVVIAMVMAYQIVVTSSSRLTKLACALFLPLGALAIFMTASRTAVLALVVATLVMLFDPRNLSTRRLVVIGVMTAIMALVVLQSVSQSQLDRIATTRSEVTNGSLDQRTTQWQSACVRSATIRSSESAPEPFVMSRSRRPEFPARRTASSWACSPTPGYRASSCSLPSC
jgi:HAMP domain-containing protein